MPYGGPVPDPWTLVRERTAWQLLRSVAPWSLAAPAVYVVTIALQSNDYSVLRRWVHAWVSAYANHRPLPAMPTGGFGSTSTAITLTTDAAWLLAIVGIVGWLRFAVASMRTAEAAKYPRRHHAVATCIGFFVPILGPFVALGATRECLPRGHEARRALMLGWLLVAAGEVGWLAVWVTVLWTASPAAAWTAAAICGALWVGAAVELPAALQAIAEDHAALGVRPSRAPS
jgi:hypothetical protein